jgi:zinc protease
MDRGAFVVYALSKSESTCRATDLLLEQINRIRENPVTDEELLRARDGILNSRAFDFDSSEEIVRDFMDLVYYGLPEDHSEKVMEGIGKVTKEDVQAAAKALLDPSKIAALAVGDPAKMDCSFSRYAEKAGVSLQEIPLEKTP